MGAVIDALAQTVQCKQDVIQAVLDHVKMSAHFGHIVKKLLTFGGIK